MQGPRQHYVNYAVPRRNSACPDEESIADRETARALNDVSDPRDEDFARDL